MPKKDLNKPCLLTTVFDQTEAALIGALLKDAGLPFYVTEKGIGGYMKIYMGYSIYGKEFYVNESVYKDARELLDYFYSENDDYSDQDYEVSEDTIQEEEPKKEKLKFNYPKRSSIARFIVIIMILTYLLIFVLNELEDLGWFS